MTIIIIDDDKDLLKLLNYSFEAEGCSVLNFTTGKEALNYLLNEERLKSISLVILDRILPDMDGLDILKTLEEKKLKSPPVLILSILSSDKDILVGLKYGAIDYITKPFNLEILMEKAKTIFHHVK